MPTDYEERLAAAQQQDHRAHLERRTGADPYSKMNLSPEDEAAMAWALRTIERLDLKRIELECKKQFALCDLHEAEEALRKIADTESTEGYLRDIRGGNAEIAAAVLTKLAESRRVDPQAPASEG